MKYFEMIGNYILIQLGRYGNQSTNEWKILKQIVLLKTYVHDFVWYID